MIWRLSPQFIVALCGAATLALLAYSGAISELLRIWEVREEYSYGYMIPVVTAFLVWQRKDQLEKIEFDGAWTGVLLTLLGLFIYLVGELSTLHIVVQYSMVAMVLGVALAVTGWRAFRIIAVPLLFLIFMIPLPQFLLTELSQELQLISSRIGVAFIRMFDISVYLEGNVIDLGTYKLQVVEACSGLRYLFPLMALGFIVAYFFNGSMWKKLLLFLSTIPITVLMNSFRIGAIGVLVEYWGIEMAEGFLHDFEGWVIFMACLAVLVGEMWLLAKVGPNKQPLHVAFGIDMPDPTPKNVDRSHRRIPLPFYPALGFVLMAAIAAQVLPERSEIIPERKPFAMFPMKLDEWRGRTDALEQIVLDELKLDDYIYADFTTGESAVNLYIAYYASQRKGQSAHSPRTCIPGGGWKINNIETVPVKISSRLNLKVNRVEVQKGDYKQLVYYWFQGRGRQVTNEYLVKWFIFWDSLRVRRTDGALVRLTALVPPGSSMERVEARLKDFLEELHPVLDDYVPE
jgi:exosortase D (VPLPA-CTERM-specific)